MSKKNEVPVMVTPPSPETRQPGFNMDNGHSQIYPVQGQEQQQFPKHRRPTPAANASCSIQKTYGFGQSGSYGAVLPMSKVAEEDESKEDLENHSNSDNEMSGETYLAPGAQAAALSAFLSVCNSDSDEAETTQARITDVYREPLDLDGLEALVLGILRTGKLTIQGTPGDMTKIQPAIFALQANEKELPQMLPQVIQSPLFIQKAPIAETSSSSSSISLPSSVWDILEHGQIRLGMFIDTAIYTLLKGHCAKNAKQAEAIITTLMTTNYIPVDSFLSKMLQMPPMIFQSSMSRQTSRSGSTGAVNGVSSPPPTGKDTSSSSISSMSTTTSATSVKSSSSNSTSSLEEGGNEDAGSKLKDGHNSVFKNRRGRKESKVHTRPLSRHRSNSSEYSDDEGSQSTWRTSIVDNSMLVCQYGSAPFPLLMWNPKLTLDLQVKSSIGLLCGIVTGIDPSKPIVTIKVINSSSFNVAFSIRSYRQSTIFAGHVVYPTKGLHILEKGQNWEDNVELFPNVKGTSEIFVIDLLVCTMEEQPSWNIVRKYAAMRAVKSESHLVAKRLTRKRHSIFYLPGTKDQKEENMKVIISHGLQCVVKGKLDEAEVIFTQALLLPDFQRIELKAFVYVCLAVVANKRQNKGHYDSLLPVLNEVSAASQLVDAVEETRGTVRMPRMVQLVKQLRKELDIHKIFSEHRQKADGKKLPRVDDVRWKESESISLEGGTLSCKSTTMHIPQNAVTTATQITLSTPDVSQLSTMLRTTGWDKTVKIITAVHIDCSPITGHFGVPLSITTTLPASASSAPQCLRLVHSNYLRHWQDITDDEYSSVEIRGDKVVIETDKSGWLAVTSVSFDPSLIILKAMRSLSVEPITLHFSVYGLTVPDTQMMQVATFISPGVPADEKPQHHFPIAFPHTVQAYPGERLQLRFDGHLEPETSMNEQSLNYELNVRHSHVSICEKWLRLTTPPDTPLSGRMVVSSCRTMTGDWESIAEIRLSSKTGFTSSTSDPKLPSSGGRSQ